MLSCSFQSHRLFVLLAPLVLFILPPVDINLIKLTPRGIRSNHKAFQWKLCSLSKTNKQTTSKQTGKVIKVKVKKQKAAHEAIYASGQVKQSQRLLKNICFREKQMTKNVKISWRDETWGLKAESAPSRRDTNMSGESEERPATRPEWRWRSGLPDHVTQASEMKAEGSLTGYVYKERDAREPSDWCLVASVVSLELDYGL